MIRPSTLPRVRDRMAALLTDPASPLRHVYTEFEFQFDVVARHLATGGLYWVSSDMAGLATAAGRALDSVRFTTADRPAGTGLMVMDGGVGWWKDFPVDAISWGPAPDGLLLMLWVDRQRMIDNLARSGARLGLDQVPHLVPLSGHTLPVSAEHLPVDELDDVHTHAPTHSPDQPCECVDDVRTLATTLAAAWHLMEQPTLADRTPGEIDRRVRGSYRRAGRPAPEVTIVDLRSIYRPGDREHAPQEEPGRYSHRWVVTGHWRDQPHGPGRMLRKRIWIPDYVKGPQGAPLLVHERVNVWRR